MYFCNYFKSRVLPLYARTLIAYFALENTTKNFTWKDLADQCFFTNAWFGCIDQLAEEASSEEEDNVGEQEQEEMVECMDRFEQLFARGCFEEAAIVATTSPQDILRTAQTFERFKVRNDVYSLSQLDNITVKITFTITQTSLKFVTL